MERAALFGLAAAAAVAIVYGILADPFGLSWGLIIVGIVGGAIIGAAVARGAFDGRFHLVVPAVRWLAAIVAVVAWLMAALVAYVASQLFYQAATTPLIERISVAGFFDYLSGSLFGPSIFGLAAMAFMAWRGAK
jgi:hypothetical protein